MRCLALTFSAAMCSCYASHTLPDRPGDAALPDAALPRDAAAPRDATPLATSITLSITVGDDALADLAWPLRTDHSHAFGYVRLRGSDTPIEIDLNENAEWPAGTTHERAIPLPAGVTVGDVAAVGIRHEAAGPEVATDNWTMSAITIGTDTGDVLFVATGTPLWTFQRHAGQQWEHVFTP